MEGSLHLSLEQGFQGGDPESSCQEDRVLPLPGEGPFPSALGKSVKVLLGLLCHF